MHRFGTSCLPHIDQSVGAYRKVNEKSPQHKLCAIICVSCLLCEHFNNTLIILLEKQKLLCRSFCPSSVTCKLCITNIFFLLPFIWPLRDWRSRIFFNRLSMIIDVFLGLRWTKDYHYYCKSNRTFSTGPS